MSSFSEKAKQLNERLMKKYSSDTPIIFTGDVLPPSYRPLATNVDQLNSALAGGIPRGSATLISGKPGSGKTAIAMSAAADAVRQGLGVLYLNFEPPTNRHLAEIVGLDLSKIALFEATPKLTADQVLDLALDFLRQQKTNALFTDLGIIVIDSVNAMIPKSQIETRDDKGFEKATMTMRARLLTRFIEEVQGCGYLTGGAALLFIAQLRANLNRVTPRSPETIVAAPWGLRFGAKTVIELNPYVKYDAKTGVATEQNVTFTLTKTLGNIPLKGQYSVIPGEGPNDSERLIDKGLEYGFITLTDRAVYAITTPSEVVTVKGKPELRNVLSTSRVLRTELRELVRAYQAEHNIVEAFASEPIAELADPMDSEESPEDE